MKKKIMSIVLAAMMVFGLSATAFAADSQTYTDVPSTHWAYSSIESCTKKGLMQGVGDGKFDPEGTLTRAQVAQICYNAYRDRVKGGAEGAISDVAANAWYRDAMHWMLANGIISGTVKEDGKTYCYPDAKASRKYVALVLYRLSEKLGVELPKTDAAVVFSDVGELGEGYRTAISALQQAGVISGFPDGTYMPDGSLTRAQAAKLFDSYTNIEGLKLVAVTPQPPTGDFLSKEVYDQIKPYAESLGYNCSSFRDPYNDSRQMTFTQSPVLVSFALFHGNDYWRCIAYSAYGHGSPEEIFVYNLDEMKAVLERYAK